MMTPEIEECRETELSKHMQAQQLIIEQLGKRVCEIESRLISVLGPPIPQKNESEEEKASQPQAPLLKALEINTTRIMNIDSHLEQITKRLVC